MHYLYLLSLIIVIICLCLADYRYKLGFWSDVRRATATIVPAMVLFVAWDVLGITKYVFFPGHAKITSGILLAPKFPIEEIFFLFVLSYATLLVYRGISVYADVYFDR